MTRRWRWTWTCVPIVLAVALLCLAPAYYLLMFKGGNYWGSGILRERDGAPEQDIRLSPATPTVGRLHGKTGINRTKPETSTQREILDPSPIAECCLGLLNLNKDRALVFGHRRQHKGFLTIGIPYIPRAGGTSDLKKTIQSLIENAPGELLNSQVSIVILTSALDAGYRKSALGVVSAYPDHVRSGLLQLVEAPRSFYPAEYLSSLGGDPAPAERVRASLGSAFLLAYARDTSRYYLHLSDDLRAPPGYLRTILDDIGEQDSGYWVAIEFYPVGFTGKLFRGSGRDLQQMIHLLTEYCSEHSPESLFSYFKNLNVQQRDIVHRPPLFSSL